MEKPVRSGGRRRLVVGLALAAGALLAGGYWYLRPTPQPPAVDLADADPAIARAVTEARQGVLAAPRSAAAWGRLGMVLAAHDFRAEANACFAQAQLLDPNEPRWAYLQGVGLSLGDPEAALPKLRRAVERSSDTPDAPRLGLAEVLVSQGHGAEAEEVLRPVLARVPSHPRAHLIHARLALQQGDVKAARDHLAFALDDSRTRQAAAALLAEVELRLGDRVAAARDLRRAESLPPDLAWPDPWLQEIDQLRVGAHAEVSRAERLLGAGQSDRAAALLQRAVRDQPRAAGAWLILGRAELARGRLSAAEAAFARAAELEPGMAEAYYLEGQARLMQGFASAADSFRRALERKPDFAVAAFGLGQSLLRQGDRPGALAAFRTAVRLRPNQNEARVALAGLLIDRGQDAEALAQLRAALQVDPDDRAALGLLGKVLARAGVL